VTSRLVAIVMHGSGSYYLEPLLASGRLPNLRQFIADGQQREFAAVLPLTAGAWVTMLTGESIGVHGVIDHIDRDARRYDGMAGRLATSADYHDRTLLSSLSSAGRRVASIYLPMTWPPWPLNGIMISGFPLPDERRPPTYPPDLGAGMEPLSHQRLFRLRYERKDLIDSYLKFNLQRIETLTREACQGDFDVVLSCLPTVDLAHHYFWRPDDPAALAQIHGYCDQVDAAIGRILDAVGDQTTVAVFSDHGDRAAPRRMFGINRWLEHEGLLTRRHSALAGPGTIAFTNRAVQWAKRHRWNHLLGNRIRGRVRRRVSSLTHNTVFVDWSHTRAYGLDFICPLAGVEVNLRGRQAAGIVSAEEYESLRDEILERLTGATDGETGRRIFARVCRREDMFHGPHLDRFPDVIGLLDAEYDVKGHLDLPVVGPNPGQWDYPFMGYHSADAFFSARGPGIRPGSIGASSPMVDLAPTLLAIAGVTPPPTMEGRPFDF
jgi:predicted AlkP superfamily phosphohydrolase/phosphomutase